MERIPPYEVDEKSYYIEVNHDLFRPIDIVDGDLVALSPEVVAWRQNITARLGTKSDGLPVPGHKRRGPQVGRKSKMNQGVEE